ncbi:transcriptional regulator GutM [Salinicoccus carnicancri]|uniref:transcriptional regulator GutM n=1 Tax=Salinicoccus carnicancri TaxID=558170 RepID=UPI00031467E1|nr:transcriptional regulator GutM [Salinicoccus carnicancri]
MQTWIFIALLFAVLWGLQFLLTHYQLKNYHQTIREMSKRGSGYLGVGRSKRRFGKGVVMVLVADVDDVVVEARKMEGVTVFSRFEEYSELAGQKMSSLLSYEAEPQLQQAIVSAVEKIEVTKADKERQG